MLDTTEPPVKANTPGDWQPTSSIASGQRCLKFVDQGGYVSVKSASWYHYAVTTLKSVAVSVVKIKRTDNEFHKEVFGNMII